MGLNIRQVITQNFEGLKDYLKSLESVAVAFSSGVDSTFLLKTAKDVLGDKVIAITAKSLIFPEKELNSAIKFCKDENIKHIVFDANILKLEGFKQNSDNRCYVCKKYLFEKFLEIAKENGMKYVIEGSSKDFENESCKEIKLLEEIGVKSPLKETNLSKDEVRLISNVIGLDTWNKLSNTCLATRFCYKENITKEKLKRVNDAEQILFSLGFRQYRVNINSNTARIEISREELAKILSNREKIVERLTAIGFDYVTLDLKNFSTGSIREIINEAK